MISIPLGFLAGCQTTGRVIEELPPPPGYVRPPRPVPAPVPKPAPVSAGRSIRGATIVLDPGHGGQDNGAPGYGGRDEKHLVLAIALEVARLLKAGGANVIFTRSSDRFIELDDRAAIAERNQADLFVSIHANSIKDRPDVAGLETYIYTQASAESQRAAWSILSSAERAGLATRGLHRRNFRVLSKHSRPAVLIECGYLTNAEERRQLNDSAYRSKLAAVIADGIVNYFGG